MNYREKAEQIVRKHSVNKELYVETIEHFAGPDGLPLFEEIFKPPHLEHYLRV